MPWDGSLTSSDLWGSISTRSRALIAFGVALGLMLLPIVGPVGLIVKLGMFALKFIDIQHVIDTIVKPALEWVFDKLKALAEVVLETIVRPAMEWFTETALPKIKEVWEAYVKPALEAMSKFLSETLAIAIETAQGIIEGFIDVMTFQFPSVGQEATETGNIHERTHAGLGVHT